MLDWVLNAPLSRVFEFTRKYPTRVTFVKVVGSYLFKPSQAGFLMFSGGIEKDRQHQIGYPYKKCKSLLVDAIFEQSFFWDNFYISSS